MNLPPDTPTKLRRIQATVIAGENESDLASKLTAFFKGGGEGLYIESHQVAAYVIVVLHT